MSQTLDANILLYASDDRSPFHAIARQVVEGIAQGPATAASGVRGARYSGEARSSAVSAPTVVPAAAPNRPTAWSAG